MKIESSSDDFSFKLKIYFRVTIFIHLIINYFVKSNIQIYNYYHIFLSKKLLISCINFSG